jgi:hypothetical protein
MKKNTICLAGYLLVVLALSIVWIPGVTPAQEPDASCERDAVIQSFAEAASKHNVEVWARLYETSNCPSQINNGVRALLAAYMMMEIDIIPFEVPAGSGQLNPVLGWHPGSSEGNAYNLSIEPGALALISGVNLEQWEMQNEAPLISYAVEGDFEAQITLDAIEVPALSRAGGNYFMALGARSASDPLNWIRIARRKTHETTDVAAQSNSRRQGTTITSVPFTEDFVFFKVVRQDGLFSLSYSADGINWTALQEGYSFALPDEVEIFIVYGLAWPPPVNAADLRVYFYDFSVIGR